MSEKAEKKKTVIKNINGKALILKGVVDSITPLQSRFGFSWRLKMGNRVYYYSSSNENMVNKMFSVGQLAAFTVRESHNKHNPSEPYLVIDNVFFTF